MVKLHLLLLSAQRLVFPLAIGSLAVASIIYPLWGLFLPQGIMTFARPSSLSNNGTKSGFPTTQFTPHVQKLTEHYDFARMEDDCECDHSFQFQVSGSKKNLTPTVNCMYENAPLDPNVGGSNNRISIWWCAVLKTIFQPEKKRVLPYNVSFMISGGDRWYPNRPGYCCLGSSSKGGIHSITNFLEIKRMYENKTFPMTPWHNRSKVPVWRGTPWLETHAYNAVDWDGGDLAAYEQVLLSSPRLRAVDWSMRHPTLLDARVHTMDVMKRDFHWFPNATYALDKLLVLDSIPGEEYYTKYQVAVVMCGIGAAFRTSLHFSTATAVVLHDCDFHEWFAPMLKPFEHFIPLSKHLVDVDEKMRWIKENPKQVQKIAENGRQFYLEYLDFERNEEHIYEFLYRLAETKQRQDNNRSSVS